ncbi:DUF2339 domain-containing protein [Xanthobacter sp. V0B-10]|uniref:DUF2339 domain-containing protein n=1 Tax=Xanthobacter albus TaxID=3119929 RepID=UPI003727770D
MDELAWLVVVLLAFPVMSLVGLVLALRQRGRLRLLETRVAQLEAALAGGAVPSPAPLQPTAAPPRATPDEEGRSPPEPAPPGTPHWTAGLRRIGRIRENLGGIEERIGARWAVWVGGLALALGGIFLVRFAVEQNLVGPGGRVALGLVLAAALLAGGEALRRLDRRQDLDPPPAAGPLSGVPQVPALLTAVGIMTAFGSLYAAYELYHLLPPAPAFVLLGLTAVAGMLAALLHGPALAALGFAGAAVTPFLVTSEAPDAWGVALLIIVVGAAAAAVARLRAWRWFAALAVAGMGAWGLALLLFEVPQAIPAAGALALALLVVTAALLTPGHLLGPPASGRPDALATLGAALALAVAALATVTGEIAAGPLAVFIATALGALGLAWRAEAATFAATAAALAAPAILAGWSVPPAPEFPAGITLYGFGMGALLAVAGLAGARRGLQRHVPVSRNRGHAPDSRIDAFSSREPVPTSLENALALGWGVAGAAGPVLLMAAAYGRLAGFERSVPFAALALALAALFTPAAEWLFRLRRPAAASAFATGAVAALALALAFALEKGWLTAGLALISLGVAWVSTRRPLPGLRPLSAGLGLLVLARVGWEPSIAGADLGTTPVFNWLLWGYGVPALAFTGAARLLTPAGDDWSRRVLEGLALVFAVLLAALEVRHLAHGGDLDGAGTRLFETGLLAALYGAYAVGLARLAAVTGRALYRLFSDVVALLAALCALMALTADNPFATGEGVGGLVFNDLLAAYALPAAMALLYAEGQPPERRRLRLAASGLAVVLTLAYLTGQVARLFQGPVLAAEHIGAMEWYAYSATWLAFGIVLLGLGLWRGSRSLRLASAAVMVATVLKVFVSDMADLEGVLRALSFIGLGLVLVAMGWLYQRLLARRRSPEPE